MNCDVYSVNLKYDAFLILHVMPVLRMFQMHFKSGVLKTFSKRIIAVKAQKRNNITITLLETLSKLYLF